MTVELTPEQITEEAHRKAVEALCTGLVEPWLSLAVEQVLHVMNLQQHGVMVQDADDLVRDIDLHAARSMPSADGGYPSRSLARGCKPAWG